MTMQRQMRWLGTALLGAWAAMSVAAQPHVASDTIEQRVQACTACHGKQGIANNQGYFPRIAGKPAGYLFNQLQNFRTGRRSNVAMVVLIDNMTDDYLLEIATYFASLDLPYPPPLNGDAQSQAAARGRVLVKEGDPARRLPACTACHGLAMTGVEPNVPGLLGLPKDYLLAQLGAWRSGQRHAMGPDCMREISQRLMPNDLSAVATYLALQPVPAHAKPATDVQRPLPMPCGSAS